MDAPSKIYYQTMTKLDVEERLKKNRCCSHPVGQLKTMEIPDRLEKIRLLCPELRKWSRKKLAVRLQNRLVRLAPVPPYRAGLHHPLPDDLFINSLRRSSPDSGIPVFANRFLSACMGRSTRCRLRFRNGARSIRFRDAFLCGCSQCNGPDLMDKAHGGPYERPFSML